MSYLHHVLLSSSSAKSSGHLQFPDCITCYPPVLRLYHDITCSPPVPRLYHVITCFPPVPRLYLVFPSSSQTVLRHHVLPSSSQTGSRAPLQFPDCMLYLRLDKLPSVSVMQFRQRIFKEADRYFRGKRPSGSFLQHRVGSLLCAGHPPRPRFKKLAFSDPALADQAVSLLRAELVNISISQASESLEELPALDRRLGSSFGC